MAIARNKQGPRTVKSELDAETLAKFLERAGALHGEGRFDEAAELYEHVCTSNPRALAAPYFLALIDLERGLLERALERLRFVTRQDAASFEPVFALGRAFEELGQWQPAANAYRRAWTIKPQSTGARFALAHALEILGELDEAIKLYRQLAELPLVQMRALIGIARLRAAALAPEQVAEMSAAAWDGETPAGMRIGLLFALGELLEAARQDDDAFAAFLEANRLRRMEIVADVDAPADVVEISPPGARIKARHPDTVAAGHAELIARTKRIFSTEFLQRQAGRGHSGRAPIFIVGMPRSGSTLVEQILSSHGKVAGLGELPSLWRTVGANFPYRAEAEGADDPEWFRRLAEAYLDRQRAAGWGRQPFFVDKMLGNYMMIGIIDLMFPNATILHCVRDPVDTCLACFRQLFRTGNETTYDLRDIGAQYLRYREMMAHWASVLPGRVIDVVHEDLVTDPDRQIRWLVEGACKLKWDDNCLRFHQTRRAVRTASVAQVRRPIFRSSVQRWRRYEKHLGPLLEVLGHYVSREQRESR